MNHLERMREVHRYFDSKRGIKHNGDDEFITMFKSEYPEFEEWSDQQILDLWSLHYPEHQAVLTRDDLFSLNWMREKRVSRYERDSRLWAALTLYLFNTQKLLRFLDESDKVGLLTFRLPHADR